MVHTYSGHEDRVQQNLEQRIKTMDLKDKIFDVVVPKEEEVQIKQGERKTVEKKMYPGYIITMVDENEQRPKPVPLEKEEVDRIKGRMESDTPQVKIGFQVGEAVRIKDGPFADFMGTVHEVYQDRGKINVHVSFFGRETPVELDFLQVEKS